MPSSTHSVDADMFGRLSAVRLRGSIAIDIGLGPVELLLLLKMTLLAGVSRCIHVLVFDCNRPDNVSLFLRSASHFALRYQLFCLSSVYVLKSDMDRCSPVDAVSL